MGTRSTAKNHRWSEKDQNLGRLFVRAARLGDDEEFERLWGDSGLAERPEQAADTFLLLLVVATTAVRYGLKSALRSNTEVDILNRLAAAIEEVPKSRYADPVRASVLLRFIVSPNENAPLPPQTIDELYISAVCCNVAIDSSLRGKWLDRGWSNRYDALASAWRRKRRVVASSYRNHWL